MLISSYRPFVLRPFCTFKRRVPQKQFLKKMTLPLTILLVACAIFQISAAFPKLLTPELPPQYLPLALQKPHLPHGQSHHQCQLTSRHQLLLLHHRCQPIRRHLHQQCHILCLHPQLQFLLPVQPSKEDAGLHG